MVGDQRIGMTMAQAVLRFEQGDEFHVLEVARGLQDTEPVRNRVAILLLNGREVGRWALRLLCRCHAMTPMKVERRLLGQLVVARERSRSVLDPAAYQVRRTSRDIFDKQLG
jgi:hypothetical protein